MEKSVIKIGLVDDHSLLREGMANLLTSAKPKDYKIVLQTSTGEELITHLKSGTILPDIILLDINMPGIGGIKTLQNLQKLYPSINVIMLTMIDNNDVILQCIQSGAKAYLLKDVTKEEIINTIDEVATNGTSFNERVVKILTSYAGSIVPGYETIVLNEKEKRILKLFATEKTYVQIAKEMKLSIRTIEGYRDMLYDKLRVKNRVGLALYAVKVGLVNFFKKTSEM